jgi:hypothetical protein
MKRLFWKILYPLCRLNWKMGGSYKWVNVGKAAWNPDFFDPLWHYEWFGDDIPAIPNKVNLCGIEYRIRVKDKCIRFSECIGGRLIEFRRNCSVVLWSVSFTNYMPACHLDAAYRWVKAVYGDEHRIKSPIVDNTLSFFKTDVEQDSISSDLNSE